MSDTAHLYLPFRATRLEWRAADQMPPEALENPQEGAFWSEFFCEWRKVGGRFAVPTRTIETTVKKGREAA